MKRFIQSIKQYFVTEPVRKNSEFLSVVVTDKQYLTDKICKLVLTAENGHNSPDYEPGAHIDVYLPNGLVRQYSLCGSANTDYYEIAVLKEFKGRGGSLAVHQQIKEGDRLKIGHPRNLFPLQNTNQKTILFAAGIGITPILCMAEALVASKNNFMLYYCVRKPEETPYLKRIVENLPEDSVHIHYSQIGKNKRLDIASKLLNQPNNSQLYVCGSNNFIDSVIEAARDHGLSENNIHREYFSAQDINMNTNSSFEIEIQSTAEVLIVPHNLTILEVLEKHGVCVSVSCEQGICGSCVTGLIDGTAEHRDMFLSEKEKEKMDYITVCCSRAKGKRLVLNL